MINQATDLQDAQDLTFMQGTQCVKLEQLLVAAGSAATNPDGYLDQLSTTLAVRLQAWADQCQALPSGPGYLAMAEHSA
jgi:hypothetical protein